MIKENKGRPILFEHIPKTGGITLRGIFLLNKMLNWKHGIPL